MLHTRRARRTRVYRFVNVLGNTLVELDVVEDEEDVGKSVYWRPLIVVGFERRVPLHTSQFNRLLVY